jgi:hypothetical protein
VKVLLDEDLPHKLRAAIPNHDVSTVAYLGWKGLKNGELLRAAEGAGFQVFVTADKKLPKQQNLKEKALATVVLSTLDWEIMKPNLNRVVEAVDAAVPGSIQAVDCGEFRRG